MPHIGTKTLLLVLSYVAKVAGFLSALHIVPFVAPETGVVIVPGASILRHREPRR